MRSRLLLVEDHGLVAATLVAALEPLGIDAVAIDPEPTTDLVALAEEYGCELVLLDLDLAHGLHGVDLVPRLRAAGRRVVVVTGTRDELQIARALEAGAEGYVSKRSAFSELVATVRRAVAGQPVQHPSEHDRLLRALAEHRRATRSRLSAFEELTIRERQVLAGLCSGLTVQQLADEAVVAVSTVRSHVRGVLTKLHVNTQVAAVALAADVGWDGSAYRAPASPSPR